MGKTVYADYVMRRSAAVKASTTRRQWSACVGECGEQGKLTTRRQVNDVHEVNLQCEWSEQQDNKSKRLRWYEL